jgi:hypothetical protein
MHNHVPPHLSELKVTCSHFSLQPALTDCRHQPKRKRINNNPTFIFQEVQKQYIQRAAKFKACQASQDGVPIIDNQ